MKRNFPRILIGAFRGGSGKTLVSLGMLASWREQGVNLSVFKKGPDYIDASWLHRASAKPCYNLDTYLMGDQGVQRSFRKRTTGTELAFVEGNRGLFDGVDEHGQHSSAALAKLLGLSVFLVIDCTKSTRTLAAMLKGCQVLDPACDIKGVILNKVGTSRHESVIRRSIESYCGIPVFGAIPRLKRLNLYERHLGLLPPEEHAAVDEVTGVLQNLMEQHVDLPAVREAAEQHARNLPEPVVEQEDPAREDSPLSKSFSGIRMGVVQDTSFHFYYPENIEALRDGGAEIVEMNASSDTSLPKLDALYIGGGFPETHAKVLAENKKFHQSLREAVEHGLPVYAECGGAIFLGKGIELDGKFYPFVGIFPVVYRFFEKPQGHGYTLLEVEEENPIFPKGICLKGHEFHYVGVSRWEAGNARFACRVKRGYGFDGRHEGLCYKNAYASFSHLHALGESHWSENFLNKAVMENRH